VVLTHAVNTDVPGLIRGHLARDVRDATGRYRLLPQGTVIVGQQRGSLSAEDSRLLIDWQSIQLPDGRSIELSEPQGTAAMDGSLGATGRVRRHWGSRFGTALLLGALGATTQLSQPQESSELGRAASARQLAAGEVGARLNELAERTLERQFDRPPTIRIQAGARLNLLLLNDLVFPDPHHPRPGMKSPGYPKAPAEAGFSPARPGPPPPTRSGIPGGGAIVSERREGEKGGASSSLPPEGTRNGSPRDR
jgi:type IV secretion system protein VirB10